LSFDNYYFLGEAEAYATSLKATAEADNMAKKAEAWANYTEVAKTEMLLAAIPKIAAEVVSPMMKISKIKFVSSD